MESCIVVVVVLTCVIHIIYTDSDPDWGIVKSCLVKFNNLLVEGQGVIVSPRLVMTALHGGFAINTKFKESSTNKKMVLLAQWFEKENVDMALLQLEDDEVSFPKFLEILTREVVYQEKISVVSLQNGMGGALDFAAQRSSIFMFDSKTTLCRAQYYAADGLSGSGVITEVEGDGNVRVIGVHVLTHDATDPPMPIERASKKSKSADFESVSSSSSTHAKNIHGHIAYCMICIASKVNGLVKLIQDSIEQSSQKAK